jgi:TolA-binding protein
MTMFAWLDLRGRKCPARWKLTRAASSDSRDPELERHLARCSSCAAELDALRALVAQVSSLPAPPGLSAESRRAISARLLASASPGQESHEPPRRLTGVVAATAVAVAAVVIAVAARRPPPAAPAELARATPSSPSAPSPSPSRAAIRAIGSARFARTQPPPDEVVRLDDGRIELDVVPLAAGERFRVMTDNGEVEVRGTIFEVLAAQRALAAVSVSRGRVEVRSGGGRAVLDAGDRWEAVDAHRGEQPTGQPSGPRPRASQQPSKIETALFDRAWSRLRAGNPREAADGFAELEQRARGHAIEEDALYWRAVATARSDDSATAGRLFRDFLRRFPASSRRGEAAVALGWIQLEAGNVEAARQAFEQAISDPVSNVRARAAEGLRRTTRQ